MRLDARGIRPPGGRESLMLLATDDAAERQLAEAIEPRLSAIVKPSNRGIRPRTRAAE